MMKTKLLSLFSITKESLMQSIAATMSMQTQVLRASLTRRTAPLLGVVLLLVGLLALPLPALAASCIAPELYASTDTGSTTPSFIAFNSISNTGAGGCTYQNLRIVGFGRYTGTNDHTDVTLQLGTGGTLDTTTGDYHFTVVYNDGAGWGAAANPNAAAIIIGPFAGGTGFSSLASGSFNALIVNAFSSWYYKDVISSATFIDSCPSCGGAQVQQVSGAWLKTGAVDTLQVAPSVNSFGTHTRVSLYLE